MKKAIIAICAADIIFLLMLMLSGIFDGILFYTVYTLAFVLSFAAGILISRELSYNNYLRFGKREARLTLPIIPLTVFIIIITSVLTSIALSFFGLQDDTVLEGNFFEALITYALLPAVFEELLFRYLPLRVLSHHSPRIAVFISAALFAAVHLDPFQLLYAFVAGAIFMSIDIMCESVWPSVIIHFINNALSVVSFFLAEYEVFTLAYIPVLLVLSTFAAIDVYSRRDEYIRLFRYTLYK